jgi:hypothetical protein
MNTFPHPLTVSITVFSEEQLTAVYALLGGASLAAVAVASPKPSPSPSSDDSQGGTPKPETAKPSADAVEASGEVELDRDGHPWSAELHAGTKGKTKEDLWRMKPGVNRPDPVEGYPKADAGGNGGTGTKSDGPEPEASATATAAAAGPDDEEDEFAAFASTGSDSAEAAVRTWSDADLSLLNNQAAQALGGPDKVKELIAKFVTKGETAHSRNIPEDKREEYAQAIEQVAGIEFAG